ncbi:MAG: biotin synthase BioB [Candidatus Margulisiibacteriota bacterium]
MKNSSLLYKSLNSQDITPSEALSILETDQPYSVFEAANVIREHFNGNKISLCSISNAKSGRCSEDCKFCAQSAHYQTAVTPYSLKSKSEILKEVQMAQESKADRFSIVTSGKSILSETEYNSILEMISGYPSEMGKCASLGTLSFKQCKMLRNAGLETYHHNLETSRSYYPQICTTHSYEERLETLKNAKKAGLTLCSGGIFGLGETLEQRVELAFALKEVDPDGIPINFLSPIPGTPLENMPVIEPLDALKIIAMFRFVHPTKTIRIGGGREKALRSLQPLMFIAGANAVLTGNYLTTAGKTPQEDWQMIKDLGLLSYRMKINT